MYVNFPTAFIKEWKRFFTGNAMALVFCGTRKMLIKIKLNKKSCLRAAKYIDKKQAQK